MSGKLKKLFSFLVKEKTAFFLLALFVFSFVPLALLAVNGAPTPTSSIFGGVVGEVLGSVLKLATSIPMAAVGIGAAVLGLLFVVAANLSGILLQWVISPAFTNLSYTNVGLTEGMERWNPVVDAGLNITQGFVNMILVLVLVYIALATILRLAGYETKKLLVTFVIVALLVNFAPVIVGLIIDASNIAMNFFLQDLKPGQNLIPRLGKVASFFGNLWDAIVNTDFAVLANATAKVTILGIFNLVAAVMYFLFAVLFIARYIVLWILVILAPIAFVAYVLPGTKRLWSLWWNNLVQWSIIGITAAFFLFLAERFIEKGFSASAPQGGTIGIGGQGGTGNLLQVQSLGIPGELLLDVVPLVFLVLAFVFGLATSAMGASAIMSATLKGRIGKAATWLPRKAGIAIAKKLEAPARKGVQGVSKFLSKIPGARWAIPEPMRKFGETKPAVDRELKEAGKYSSRTIARESMSGVLKGIEHTRLLDVIDRNDSQDIFDEGKKRFGVKTDQELLQHEGFQEKMRKVLKISRDAGMLTTTLRKDPRLARLVAGQEWAGDYADMNEKEAMTKAISEARPQHTAKWEPEVFSDTDVIQPMVGEWEQARWQKVGDIKNGQASALDSLDVSYSKWVDDEDKGLVSFARSQGKEKEAQTLLHSLKEGSAEQKKDADTKIWEGLYKDYIASQYQGHTGYHKALENQRFTQASWRAAQYLVPEKRKTREEKEIAKKEEKQRRKEEETRVAWAGGPAAAVIARALKLSEKRPKGEPGPGSRPEADETPPSPPQGSSPPGGGGGSSPQPRPKGSPGEAGSAVKMPRGSTGVHELSSSRPQGKAVTTSKKKGSKKEPSNTIDQWEQEQKEWEKFAGSKNREKTTKTKKNKGDK